MTAYEVHFHVVCKRNTPAAVHEREVYERKDRISVAIGEVVPFSSANHFLSMHAAPVSSVLHNSFLEKSYSLKYLCSCFHRFVVYEWYQILKIALQQF